MNKATNNFYIYIYLDPRKKGAYNYQELSFDYEPIYIGKGKGNRMDQHIKTKPKDRFHRTIQYCIQQGLNPIRYKLKENLPHEEACFWEIFYIDKIGRDNEKKGPLHNITAGGEGAYKRIVSEETRKKHSEWHKGRPAWNKGLTKEDPRVANYTKNLKNRKYSVEALTHFSEGAKRRANTEEYRKWFTENNPAIKYPDRMKKAGEKKKLKGIVRGKNNPRYISLTPEQLETLKKGIVDNITINKIAKNLHISHSTAKSKIKEFQESFNSLEEYNSWLEKERTFNEV